MNYGFLVHTRLKGTDGDDLLYIIIIIDIIVIIIDVIVIISQVF